MYFQLCSDGYFHLVALPGETGYRNSYFNSPISNYYSPYALHSYPPTGAFQVVRPELIPLPASTESPPPSPEMTVVQPGMTVAEPEPVIDPLTTNVFQGPLIIQIPKYFEISRKIYEEYQERKCIKFIVKNYKCYEQNFLGVQLPDMCTGDPSKQEWICQERRLLEISLTVIIHDSQKNYVLLEKLRNCLSEAPRTIKKFDAVLSIDAGRTIRKETLEKARMDALNVYMEEARKCITSENEEWFNQLKFELDIKTTIVEAFKNITPDPPLPPGAVTP